MKTIHAMTWFLGIITVLMIWLAAAYATTSGDPFPKWSELSPNSSPSRQYHSAKVKGGHIFWVTNPNMDSLDKIEMWVAISDEW